MFELVDDLEFCLERALSVLPVGWKLKFVKSSRNRNAEDYNCCLPETVDKLNLDVKMFEDVVKEHKPYLADFIKFELTSGMVNLYFIRPSVYYSVIKCVMDTKEDYGRSKMVFDQVFVVKTQLGDNDDSLSGLRAKLVGKVLSKLIPACGGLLLDEMKSEIPATNIIVKLNSVRGEGIVICVGPVIGGKNLPKTSSVSINEYKRIRREEISSFKDPPPTLSRGNESLEDMLKTSILFDMLLTSVWKSLTLHLEECDLSRRSSCKGTIFVLYNYARMSVLCSKFEEGVCSGFYPPLPSIDAINFSLLSEDDEWALMSKYVLYWPATLKKSLEGLEEGKPKMNSVFVFLSSLATDFSLYYRKTRILTEPRPHLLPVLYARIYLLKALKQIFSNALRLLSINPLDKM